MGEIFDAAEAERLNACTPDGYLRRREFLERLTRTVGATMALAAGVGVEPLMAEAARRQSRVRLPSPRNKPIDTFVDVMMENRSFDHLLGWMPNADGRQAGLSYANSAGQRFSTYPLAPDFRACGHANPGHIWEQARVQFNNGKVDGFLLDGSGNDRFAIGFYREHDLPCLPQLAKTFTTYDRYFPSLLSSTNPNRVYMHAAQSYGDKHLFAVPGDGAPQYPTPRGFPANTTIEARLARKGLSGITFYSDVNTARCGVGTGSSARRRSRSTSSVRRLAGCRRCRSSTRSC